MLLAASEALAAQVKEENYEKGLIYPPFSNIIKISANIAAKVAAKAYELVKKKPKVKNRAKYPEDWELIEPTLHVLILIVYYLIFWTTETDLRDRKRKCDAVWPIFKLAHQKSRYIFYLHHQRNEISKVMFTAILLQNGRWFMLQTLSIAFTICQLHFSLCDCHLL